MHQPAPAPDHPTRRSRGAASRLLVTLGLALLFAAAMVLPDQIGQHVGLRVRTLTDATAFLSALAIATIVMLVRPRFVVLGTVIVLGLLEVLHFFYIGYFGGVIDANAIAFGLSETHDVAQAALQVSGKLFVVPLLVVSLYTFVGVLVVRAGNRRFTLPYFWPVWAALVAFGPATIVAADDPVRYFPIDYYPSAANSYLTLSTLVARGLQRMVPAPEANAATAPSPVAVRETTPPDKLTIVLVMSESLSSRHMSLFGYARETTPRLDRLRSEDGFVQFEGIAGGVGTISSLHSFWNGVRDPRDKALFESQRANLFRLARLHGFHTALVSAQGNNLLRGDGTRFIDELVTDDVDRDGFERAGDERLLDYAQTVALTERNLVVFHQRSVHAPYERNYTRHPELALWPTEGLAYEDYQRNSYDNAVRYNDLIIATLLETMRRRVAGPLVAVVTSDHGQLLGESGDGLFGHGRLLPAVATVPVLFLTRDVADGVLRDIRALDAPTHAELVTLLSRWMGFEVNDPGAEAGEFYVNGTARYGAHGFIRVLKQGDARGQPTFEVVPAA